MWSHETCSSSSDRRGVGAKATSGCNVFPGALERTYTPLGDIHHYPSNLCSTFILAYGISAGQLWWIWIPLILGRRKLQEMRIQIRKENAAEVNSAIRVEGTRFNMRCRQNVKVVGATSRRPHSVAQGLPEWSHETCVPRQWGGRCLNDQRVQCPSRDTGRVSHSPGDIHHAP